MGCLWPRHIWYAGGYPVHDLSLSATFITGGWLLRKAWKIYEKVHADVTKHFEDSKRNGKVKVKVDTESDKLLELDEKGMLESGGYL